MEILDRYQDALRPDWLALVLFLLLVLLALVRIFGRERLLFISSSVLKPRISRQEVRGMSENLDIGYLGLWAISVFTLGLFVHQELILQGQPLSLASSPFLSYLALSGAIALYFIVKYVFIKLSMFLFGEDLGGSEYFYNTFMLFALVGVALLPLVIFRAYVQWLPTLFLCLGMVIICGAILYQWGRGWIIASAYGAKSSYIILYFCVLEILPFGILLKVLIDASVGA